MFQNRRKDEVPDLFDELEVEIFQKFQITPEQLQKDRVDYAIGKNTVLSACKVQLITGKSRSVITFILKIPSIYI